MIESESWSSAHFCHAGPIGLPAGNESPPCSSQPGTTGSGGPDSGEASAFLLGLNASIPLAVAGYLFSLLVWGQTLTLPTGPLKQRSGEEPPNSAPSSQGPSEAPIFAPGSLLPTAPEWSLPSSAACFVVSLPHLSKLRHTCSLPFRNDFRSSRAMMYTFPFSSTITHSFSKNVSSLHELWANREDFSLCQLIPH